MPSPITVSGLVVTPGFGQTFLEWTLDDPNWNGLEQLRLDRVEVWASATNDRAAASKVAEGLTEAIHRLATGAARYYWIKARNRSGIYSEWYPVSATGGIAAAQSALISANGYVRLPSGLILQWGAGVTIANGTAVITFPIAFPNGAFQLIGNVVDNQNNVVHTCKTTVLSTTGGTFIVAFIYDVAGTKTIATQAGETVWWQALGY